MKRIGSGLRKLHETRQMSCDLSSFKALEMFLLECDSMHLPCVRDRCQITSDFSIKLLLLVVCIPHETHLQCRAYPMIIHLISCDSSYSTEYKLCDAPYKSFCMRFKFVKSSGFTVPGSTTSRSIYNTNHNCAFRR